MEYVWAIATVIFSYTGLPQVKISQKVLGGLLFFDSYCIYCFASICHVLHCIV